jgi:aminoglycoside phosphotransferase (APT) family kinase protein
MTRRSAVEARSDIVPRMTDSGAIAAEAVTRYLEHVVPGAEAVEVGGLRRILGGASRHTWSCDASWTAGGERCERGLIFRVDPEASLLPSHRDLEFRVYRALAGTAIPAPEALWVEGDARWLGAPFFVMERIDGCETAPQALFGEPYASVGERIGERLFEIGGRIAALDWEAAGFGEFMETPAAGECAERELAYWERAIEEARLDAQPVVRAAIDWLRRHPPPPAQRVSVVHGDYRNGNVLYDERGEIHGVLDWEMAHLGDPVEDLAWTCMPDWRWGRLDRYGGLLEPERALGTWQAASGLRVEREAFHWWSLFSQVKAQAIWLTGERAFLDGRTEELKLPLIGTVFKAREDRVMLELLGWAGRRE